MPLTTWTVIARLDLSAPMPTVAVTVPSSAVVVPLAVTMALVLSGTWVYLWQLFGAANQLMAALSLLLCPLTGGAEPLGAPRPPPPPPSASAEAQLQPLADWTAALLRTSPPAANGQHAALSAWPSTESLGLDGSRSGCS